MKYLIVILADDRNLKETYGDFSVKKLKSALSEDLDTFTSETGRLMGDMQIFVNEIEERK